jgi:sulfite exporter TauE/SafE
MCGPLATFATGALGGKGALYYHAGRLGGYAVVGLIAGATGDAVRRVLPPAWASALLSFALAASFALAGLRLLRSPAPARLVRLGSAPRRPGLVERAFALAPRHPAALGALTALLPCGALYGSVLLAASTGSMLGGIASMVTFALISGVGLAAISAVAVKARALIADGIESTFFRRVLATALLVGAVLFVVRPISALTSSQPATCHAPDVR